MSKGDTHSKTETTIDNPIMPHNFNMKKKQTRLIEVLFKTLQFILDIDHKLRNSIRPYYFSRLPSTYKRCRISILNGKTLGPSQAARKAAQSSQKVMETTAREKPNTSFPMKVSKLHSMSNFSLPLSLALIWPTWIFMNTCITSLLAVVVSSVDRCVM